VTPTFEKFGGWSLWSYGHNCNFSGKLTLEKFDGAAAGDCALYRFVFQRSARYWINSVASWSSATHYSTLQRTTAQCNTLQHTATYSLPRYDESAAKHCNTLQHTATHCNTLKYTATHCNTLQHIRYRGTMNGLRVWYQNNWLLWGRRMWCLYDGLVTGAGFWVVSKIVTSLYWVDVPTHAYNTPKYAPSLTHTYKHSHTHTPQTQAHRGCLFALVRVVCKAGYESRFLTVASV